VDSIPRISALPGRRRRSALGSPKISSVEGEDRGQNQRLGGRDYEPSTGTRVTASIGYEPEGILEKTEEVLGITSGRVERDLEQFRDYIQGKAKGSGDGEDGSQTKTPSKRMFCLWGDRF
jgi:hypothetical protein